MQNEWIPLIIPSYEPDDRLITLLQNLKFAGFTNIVVLDDGSGGCLSGTICAGRK